MATIQITLPGLAGQTGLTLEAETTKGVPYASAQSLVEGSTGVFSATFAEDFSGYQYELTVRSSLGVILQTLTHRGSSGSSGGAGDALSSLVADDIQGYYGLLTNFYFVGSTPTATEITTETVDQWIDINFDVDALGTFDYRPSAMQAANAVGHTGSGTVADPIVFLIEGLTTRAACNFRASLTFEPDIDEAQLETRLIFDRHTGTTPNDQFPIADVSLSMTQGADIEYDAEPMLSFFVGDTIDTNGVGDAGKCKFQIRSSVEGTLRMRALTWYIQA